MKGNVNQRNSEKLQEQWDNSQKEYIEEINQYEVLDTFRFGFKGYLSEIFNMSLIIFDVGFEVDFFLFCF